MIRITSNLTLVLKLFLPVFFTAFYGAFTIATWAASEETLGYLSHRAFRISNTIFFLSVLLILFLTVWKLKRIELSESHVYVTNYFKTFRYELSDIKSIDQTRLLFFTLVTVRFNAVTSFGKSVVGLLSRVHLNAWYTANPEWSAQWTKK